MSKRSLKNLLLSLTALLIISCSSPPTYSRQDIAETIKSICQDEYGIEVDAWLINETVWIHAPVKLFDKEGKFKVSEEGKMDEDLSEPLRKISQSIQRALLNMDTPPLFYCFIKSDIRRLGGINLIRMNHYELVFVPDQIRLTLGTYGLGTNISAREFMNRLVLLQLHFIESRILNDNYGRLVYKYDINLTEFINLLIYQRIFDAFATPEVADNFEINDIDVNYKSGRLEVSFNIRIKKYESGIPIPLKKVSEITQTVLDSYSSFLNIKEAQINDTFNNKSETLKIDSPADDSSKVILSSSKTDTKRTLSKLYKANFYLIQGHYQWQDKNFTKAASYFEKALKVIPDYIYAMVLLAEIQKNLGHYQRALSILESTVQADPQNPSTYFSLGECYRSLGNIEKALENFQKVFYLESDYPGILEALSNIYTDLGAPGEARQYLTQAIKDAKGKNSDNPEIYRSIGSIYSGLGQYNEALEYLQKAKNLDPSYLPTYISLGNVYRLMGKSQEAIDNFENVLKSDPKSLQAKLGLAHTYLALGQYQRAITQYQEVLKNLPESSDIYITLAQAHSKLGLKTENKDEQYKALNYLEKALDLDPKSFAVYYQIANTYFNLEQYKKSVQYFNRALKLVPDSGGVYFGLGRAYYSLGQNQKAKQSFQKAHDLFYQQGDYENARLAEDNFYKIP